MTDERTEKLPRTCPSCGATTPERFCPHDGTATVEGRALFADATVLRAGDVVNGRYRIIELIGRGGYGAVYAGEHTGTHQQVALKLLMPSEDDPKTDIRRFHQEAELTASLRHPNTVRVFDVGQTQHGALFLAMELLHGQTLEDRLQVLEARNQPLPQAELLEVGIQTLKALSEAHGKGLVHRDLKPANLMLTELEGDLLVKVLDFGIARREGSTLTGHGRALGTPAYMSPEQCLGDDVDGRADLYALACILFRSLAGRTPFESETALAMMQGHALEPVPDVVAHAKLPVVPGLKNAIERALAKKPADRFQTAREMRAMLELAKNSLVPDDEAPTMAWSPAKPQAVASTASKPQGPKPVASAAMSQPQTAGPKRVPPIAKRPATASSARPSAAEPQAAPEPPPQAPPPPASPPAPHRLPSTAATARPAKPQLTVTVTPRKPKPSVVPVRQEPVEPNPPARRAWLPWAIGAGVVVLVAGLYVLLK